MQHPDEGTIHAWLDGALPPEQGAELEAHAASCAECSAAIAEARGLIAASSRIVSALDIVPSGVIPARKPAPRPWYASTQLRAAAAVIFVAGASMLLLRDRNTGSIEDLSQRVMSESSPVQAPAAAVPGTSTPERSAAGSSALKAASPNVGSGRIAETGQADGTRTQAEDRVINRSGAAKVSAGTAVADAAAPDAVSGSAVSAPAAPAPPPVPMSAGTTGNVAGSQGAPIMNRDSAVRRSFGESLELSNVVVTGVASASLARPDSLIVISTDSAMGYKSVRYRTTAGVEVLLTEERTDPRRESARANRRAMAPAAAAPPPQAVQAQSDALPITTIEWFDAIRQRKYVLSGRLTKEALERIRTQIEKTSR